MKIQALKQEVRQAWEFNHFAHGALVVPKLFKAKILSGRALFSQIAQVKTRCF